MTATDRITELLRNGEGLGIEFKRCSGKVEHDVFETICAFLNRFGGDILLGVENDGTVVGVKDELVAECGIPRGPFDTITGCGYSIPRFTDSGRVYATLSEETCAGRFHDGLRLNGMTNGTNHDEHRP